MQKVLGGLLMGCGLLFAAGMGIGDALCATIAANVSGTSPNSRDILTIIGGIAPYLLIGVAIFGLGCFLMFSGRKGNEV